MPFALDSSPSTSELSEAINYLLGNFGANISADPNTGEIKGPTGNVIAYLYKYLAVKYADSADGLLNFSDSPTNRLYYGIRNSNQEAESTNPADYIWREVDGGFGTTKFLFYKVTGGRQIEFFVGTTSPGYAWQQTSSASIDLDAISVVITATPTIYQWTSSSTPPARPSTATTYTWATGAYTAPAGWSTQAPSNTTPGDTLWEISITVVQTGGLETSTLDWTNPTYPIRATSFIGSSGSATFLVTRTANDGSPPTNAEVIAVIGRNPVAGDIVTVSYNSSNNAVVYRYTTSWVSQSTYITGSLIVSNTITAANMAANSITVANAAIADGTITTAKIGNLQVNTLQIANNAVSYSSGANSSGSGANVTVNMNTGDRVFISSYASASPNPVSTNNLTTITLTANGSTLQTVSSRPFGAAFGDLYYPVIPISTEFTATTNGNVTFQINYNQDASRSTSIFLIGLRK